MKKGSLWAMPLVLLAAISTRNNLIAQEKPVGIHSNERSAINWTIDLTWQQVKAKAKKEDKYIFVDCFTTWCKPCREMDAKVYTVDSVGEFLNKGFIDVKLQMDQTKNDDAYVKSWYKTVKSFENQYRISVYPSYLFFDPNGEIVSKETSYKDPAAFLQTARNAKNPSTQYFVLLKNYRKGMLDDEAKRRLINMARQLGDTANYHSLRNSYFTRLHRLPKEKLFTKENIEFIAGIISQRSQPVFDLFYPNGASVDKVMQKQGYARHVVEEVIYKEKVAPVLQAANDAKQEPDWKSIYDSIAKDYNSDYADRNVLGAKIYWYGSIQPDGLKYARSLNDKMEKYGSDTTDLGEDFQLNNAAYLIWQGLGAAPTSKISPDEINELNRVCGWMEGVARRGEKLTSDYAATWDTYIDTYANLLYKVGRTPEAIQWEELAIEKANKRGEQGKDFLEAYKYSLEKMKKGDATWPVKEAK